MIAPAGPAPADDAAFADVLASTGHMLDGCLPTTPGVAVTGRIKAPNVRAALPVRCSIGLRHEQGFDVAQVLVFSPANLQGVRLAAPYEQFHGWPKWNTNAEAIGWEFMVTQGGARSVDSVTIDSTKRVRHRHALSGRWTPSGWAGHVDSDFCGSQGYDPGGARGPTWSS